MPSRIGLGQDQPVSDHHGRVGVEARETAPGSLGSFQPLRRQHRKARLLGAMCTGDLRNAMPLPAGPRLLRVDRNDFVTGRRIARSAGTAKSGVPMKMMRMGP